jgi:hypothetical protein
MGMCLDSTPAMGDYDVEVRRESFRICNDVESIEYPIEDLPKIRAALDLVEAYLRERGR